MLGEQQKFLRLLQQENESIASWETRIRNQAAQCEYQDFAEELMRDQFIAGLMSVPLRVKLIGKGHRHKTTQAKVKLREMVEVAKTWACAGVELDNKLNSNNPILSRKTQKRKPSLQSVIKPNGLRGNIFRIWNLNMERKQKSRGRRSTLHPLAIPFPALF